jgi:hypothetical protein
MLQQTIDKQQKEISTLKETIERLTGVAAVEKYRQEYASPGYFMRKGPPVVDFVPPRGYNPGDVLRVNRERSFE